MEPPALPPRRPSATPSPAASVAGVGSGGAKEAAAAGEIGRLEEELEGLRRRAVDLKKVGWRWSETAAVTICTYGSRRQT